MSGRGKGGKGLGKGGAKRHRKVLRDNIQGELALPLRHTHALRCWASELLLGQLDTPIVHRMLPTACLQLAPGQRSCSGVLLTLASTNMPCPACPAQVSPSPPSGAWPAAAA